MKFIVVGGKGESNISELNAFHAALADAGIAHLNLVGVSSILPSNAKEIKNKKILTKIKPGTIVHCVISKASSTKRSLVLAGLAYGLAKKHGLIIEGSKILSKENQKLEKEFKKELTEKFKECASISNIEVKKINFKIEKLKIKKKYGCAVVILLFL